jgi:hypothetical protein
MKIKFTALFLTVFLFLVFLIARPAKAASGLPLDVQLKCVRYGIEVKVTLKNVLGVPATADYIYRDLDKNVVLMQDSGKAILPDQTLQWTKTLYGVSKLGNTNANAHVQISPNNGMTLGYSPASIKCGCGSFR